MEAFRGVLLDVFEGPSNGVHVRVDLERDLHGDPGGGGIAVAQADLGETGQGSEVSRLEGQGRGDVVQRLRTPVAGLEALEHCRDVLRHMAGLAITVMKPKLSLLARGRVMWFLL